MPNRMMRMVAVVVGVVVGWTPGLGAQADSGTEAFVAWAKRALQPLRTTKSGAGATADLAPLGRMVAGARVVALSEVFHMSAEPLEFRNRLFQYLVEHEGFTVIALESGFSESRVANDYVRGGAGDLTTALGQGLTFDFDQLPQNAELLRWMRAYNADPAHARPLHFYGFDVPGTPGFPYDRPRTGLDDVLAYLDAVDAESAARFHDRLDRLLPSIRLGRLGYAEVSPGDRETLTATIAELVSLLERREGRFRAARSDEDYDWAYGSALGARAADLMARETRPAPPEIRGRFQADAISWILNREPGARVLVFASRVHLTSAPTHWSFSPPAGTPEAASHLRARLGRGLVTIGTAFGRGEWGGCADTLYNGGRGPPAPASFDGMARMVGNRQYYLDLRGAPPRVREWLDREWNMMGQTTNIAKGYDLLVYFDTLSTACRRGVR